jgi:peptidoglycan/LPS O-acetylase OafA/YrhL
MKYLYELDAIRAIAVLFVISNHWFPQTHMINSATRGQIGPIGVDIFFVLSGFLITRIMLTHKQEIEQG